MKKIVVKINKGQVTVKAEGFPGATCKDATKLIEKALGQVTEDTDTEEMYQEVNQEYLEEGT